MARIRSVHPDICTSEALAGVSMRVELAFVHLWLHCDDEGRAIDNVKLLRAQMFPLRDEDSLDVVTADEVGRMLDELAEAGLIVRYEVDGKRYLQVKPRSWHEYQKPQRPTKSKHPAPPSSASTPRVIAEPAPSPPRDVASGGEGSGDGSGNGEGERLERELSDDAAPDALQDALEYFAKCTFEEVSSKVYACRSRGYTDTEISAALHGCEWPRDLLKVLPLRSRVEEDPIRPYVPETPRCPECGVLSPELGNGDDCISCLPRTKAAAL